MAPSLLAHLLVATLAAEPAAPVAPDARAVPAAPVAGRVLSLQDAVNTALQHQPSLRQARSQVQAAEARTRQARAGLLPQVSASLAYQRTTANFASRPGTVPSQFQTAGGFSFSTSNFWSGTLTGSQLIYDFGQTSGRHAAARETAVAQQESAATTRLQTVLAVRTAYFNARGARALLEVARQNVNNLQRHLDQAQAGVEVGTRPVLDVVQARSDLATGQVQLINSQNNYETTKAQLNQAMGLDTPVDFEVGNDQLPPVEGESSPATALTEQALNVRPEFAQVESQIRAQELSVRSLTGSYLPSISLVTNATAAGTELASLGLNWNGGVALNWSIFSGGLTQAQVEEANATLAAFRAQRDLVRQQIALEIEQDVLALNAAKATLEASGVALSNARERLRLAEGRYQTGVGNIIELGDAQVALTSAEAQQVQAEYSLSLARASLLKALARD